MRQFWPSKQNPCPISSNHPQSQHRPRIPSDVSILTGQQWYDPEIDGFFDDNGNGEFDAAWMAGFQNGRAAQSVHNDLMAVAAVFDVGDTRIGLVTADVVRLMTMLPGEPVQDPWTGERFTASGFGKARLEVPPLRPAMQGRVNLMVNLANDAISYIIPKSEWDNEAPWIYDYEDETYGEIVSAGPDGAAAIHGALLPLLEGDGE